MKTFNFFKIIITIIRFRGLFRVRLYDEVYEFLQSCMNSYDLSWYQVGQRLIEETEIMEDGWGGWYRKLL